MLNADSPPPPIAKLPAPMHQLALDTANRLMGEGYDEQDAIAQAVARTKQESAERIPNDVDLAQADEP